MEQLPRIFDDRGVFVEPNREGLSPEVIQQLDKINAAYAAVEEQKRVVEACEKAQRDAVADLRAAEDACAPYGAYDQTRLAMDTVRQSNAAAEKRGYRLPV